MVSRALPLGIPINVHLVETSPAMRALQQAKLQHFRFDIHWHNSINEITFSPSEYTMLVAHEFFDALPIHILQVRQYIYINCFSSFSNRHLCYRKCRQVGMKFLSHQISKKKRLSQTLTKVTKLHGVLSLLDSSGCWHEILQQHLLFWDVHLLGFKTSLLVLSWKYRLQPFERRIESANCFLIRIPKTKQPPWEDVV